MTRALGTTVQQLTSYGYDCNNGQVNVATDPNSVQTTSTYSSATPYFGRLVSVSAAGLMTQYSYDDANRTVKVLRDVATLGGGQSISLDSYDQLGRPGLTQQFESPGDQTDLTKGIKVQTRYPFSSAGRFKLVTNPYRTATPTASTEDTMGWEATAFDTAGRPTSTTHYTGGAVPVTGGPTTGSVTNTYDADATNLWRTVAVADEASKRRLMRYDAASRLVQVYEDPAGLHYLTCYAYDALDDLMTVKQQGITTGVGCTSPPETRTFAYDTLKRLTDATNPESGTAHYVYDGNGNLTSRTDGNSVVSTFQYDKLNRIADKHYPAGSPGDGVFCYDGDTAAMHGGSPDWSCAGAPSTGTNLKGRTTMVSNPTSITRYSSYDSWGRILNSQQSTLSVDYPFGPNWAKVIGITGER